MSTKFAVGDEVRWESQARGSYRMKRGVIIGICPANTSVTKFIESKVGPTSNTQTSSISDDSAKRDRYVVECRRDGTDSTKKDYRAVAVAVADGRSTMAFKLVKRAK